MESESMACLVLQELDDSLLKGVCVCVCRVCTCVFLPPHQPSFIGCPGQIKDTKTP